MNGPFENDFLEAPAWLRPTNPKVKRVTVKNAATQVIPAAAAAAVAGIFMSLGLSTASLSTAIDPTLVTHYEETIAIVPEMKTELERAWDDYLSRMAKGRFAGTHIDHVREVWEVLRSRNTALPPPQTAPTEEGALAMVWDSGPHHIEVAISASKLIEWFYSNRETGLYEGEENNRLGSLSGRLNGHIRKIA